MNQEKILNDISTLQSQYHYEILSSRIGNVLMACIGLAISRESDLFAWYWGLFVIIVLIRWTINSSKSRTVQRLIESYRSKIVSD